MRSEEVLDTGTLAGVVLHDIATATRDIHTSIARRVFGTLGRPAAPVRFAHDAISATCYAGVRAAVRYAPAAAGWTAAAFVPADATSVHASPAGRTTTAALSGLFGDRMQRDHPSLSAQLTVRTHNGPRATGVAGLGSDDLGDRVVVFLHGLCESDGSWWVGAPRHFGDPDVTYGSVLRDESGWTPLYVNYNTGRRISDSGRAVADLLDRIIGDWPVPVRRLALVGHSMGGLVARSAIAQAGDTGSAWLDVLSAVILLGSPHLGAPLEQAAHRAARLLRTAPETRALGELLDRRSVGIRDLRHGALLTADWVGHDDARHDPCADVPLLPGVRYGVVGVTLSRCPDGPVARIVGDLLVPWSSSSGAGVGQGRRIAFETPRHLGRLHHFDLLDHPDVLELIRGWLTE